MGSWFRPERGLKLAAIAVLVAGLAGAVAFAEQRVDRPQVKQDSPAVAVTSASGDFRIGNSARGTAVLAESKMTPGDGARGSVRITNPNRVAFTPSLRLRTHGDPAMSDLLEMRIFNASSGGTMYAGSPAEMPRLPMPSMKPGERRDFRFAVSLPASAPNTMQGRATSFDLVWEARAAAPPPECKLRNMRARFFIFRRKPIVRLVSRYRANVSARMAVSFFERLPNGRPGRFVGRLLTKFERTGRKWRRNRIAQRRPRPEMRRFRRSRHGFFATIRVARTPGYCRQYLNLDLIQLRRYFRQYVWFQQGSFRTR